MANIPSNFNFDAKVIKNELKKFSGDIITPQFIRSDS